MVAPRAWTPWAQSPARRSQPQAEHHRRGQRGPAELRHRNHGQHTHHQQHGQRRELHHGGRRVHGNTDSLGRSHRHELRALTGATLTITGAASAAFTATSGGVSKEQVEKKVCRPSRSREPCSSSFFGARSRCVQALLHPVTPAQAPFWGNKAVF